MECQNQFPFWFRWFWKLSGRTPVLRSFGGFVFFLDHERKLFVDLIKSHTTKKGYTKRAKGSNDAKWQHSYTHKATNILINCNEAHWDLSVFFFFLIGKNITIFENKLQRLNGPETKTLRLSVYKDFRLISSFLPHVMWNPSKSTQFSLVLHIDPNFQTKNPSKQEMIQASSLALQHL